MHWLDPHSIHTSGWQPRTVSTEHTLGSAHRQHGMSGPSRHCCALIRAASAGPVPLRGVGSPLLEPAPPSSGTAHPPWQPPHAGVWEAQQHLQWSCGHAEPSLGSCRHSVTDGVGNGKGERWWLAVSPGQVVPRDQAEAALWVHRLILPILCLTFLHYLLGRGLLPSLPLFSPDAPSLFS